MRLFALALTLVAAGALAAQQAGDEFPDAAAARSDAAEVDPLAQWLPAALADDAAGDDELQKLLKERYRAAQAELTSHLTVQATGTGDGSLEGTQRAVAHLAKSALSLCGSPKEKIAVLQQQLKVRQHLEKLATTRYEQGLIPSQPYHQARYLRLSAEVDLRTLERDTKEK